MQSNGPNVVSSLNVVVLNTYCNTNRNKARLVILIVKSLKSLSDEHDTNNSASYPHVLFSLFVALY